ncbi:MAG: L,D-transpeptidase [Tenuifilum sp.]|uniref:L,D-transpeptidase n=1 Tax=Tenuifilum sp. TaxID=2760880 RepID=UPI0030B10D5E
MNSIEDKIDFNPEINPKLKRLGFVMLLINIILSGFIILYFYLTYLSQPMAELVVKNRKLTFVADYIQDDKVDVKKLQKEVASLKQHFQNLTPAQPYIVVNTTYNRFRLYKNRKQVREGFCSTGSYTLLKSHDKRQWIFHTPKGMYKVLGKVTNPVWRRPDWSYVEEGLPIPSANDPSRWEAGVLGDYALSIGDGYLIHGTIYKRFLGMPVTHGCIRMNDEDLEAVYKTLDLGSKVYIY